MQQSDCPLRVLVIGCGNIAGGFDAQRPRDAAPLTHAGAFTVAGGFVLAACVDPDEQRRRAFQERWNVAEAYENASALAERATDFDVVSICSPTALHGAHLEFALALRPRLVFCEKPVTPSRAETARWVERFEEAGVLLAVNHTRRWAPDVVRLRDELAAGAWGAVRSASGTYGKGVLNNGSHMVDLLAFLLGPLRVAAAGQPVSDFWPDDPTVPAMLLAPGDLPVLIATAHAADYALFELQLVTEQGVITMEEGGLRWRIRRTCPSPHFAGYRSLEAGAITTGEYWQAMTCAARNLRETVQHGRSLASSGRTALEAQTLCEQIRLAADIPDAPAALTGPFEQEMTLP